MGIIRSRRVRVAAIMYFLAALVCTRIPLLDYLGYEFSAFIGLVGSFVAGILVILFVGDALGPAGVPESPHSDVMVVFRNTLVVNLALLLVPLVVMLANAMIVRNCSLLEGVAFYLLIPVVSVACAASVGLLCALLVRHPKIVFLISIFATFAYAVSVGYFTPAIFSYNLFYGYFPGLTYDELITISWTLVLYRVFSLIVAVLLVWVAGVAVAGGCTTGRPWKRCFMVLHELVRARRIPVTAAAAVLLAMVYAYRCDLGFESTSRFIERTLGSQYRTEHFTIYYSQSSFTEEEIHWVAAEHEIALHQIMETLALTRQSTISSFVYPSEEVKGRLMGAGATDIAKPWSAEIHVSRESLEGTLKHELVHVVAGQFGLPIIRASLSPGLVEGLAMALTRERGNRTLHEYAAAMRASGIDPDIGRLMSATGFVSNYSSVSYVLAGSFCRFLIDRYGIRKMMQLYRSGNYEEQYGRSLESLIGSWQNVLSRYTVEEADRDAIDALFRHPPIFRKICARVMAERNAAARKDFVARNYKAAELAYEQSYHESRSYEALSGYLAAALRAGDYSVLTAAFDTIAMRDPHPARYIPLYLNIGDAAWALGRIDSAERLFQKVRGTDISDGFSEAADVRLIATADTSLRWVILPYFLSGAPDSVREVILDSLLKTSPRNSLLRYLKARIAQRSGRFGEALDLLSSTGFAGTDRQLEAIRLKMAGSVLFRLKRFQDAKVSFWLSLNFVDTRAAEDVVDDRIDRCDWLSEHGRP